MDFNVDKEDLNVFHWLKDKEPVIVKFCRKKECEKVLKAKNDLQKLDATNLDLSKRLQILLNIKTLGNVNCSSFNFNLQEGSYLLSYFIDAG